MSDEAKLGITFVICATAFLLFAIAINVTASHDCKVKAIAAGMKAGEVREACQ